MSVSSHFSPVLRPRLDLPDNPSLGQLAGLVSMVIGYLCVGCGGAREHKQHNFGSESLYHYQT